MSLLFDIYRFVTSAGINLTKNEKLILYTLAGHIGRKDGWIISVTQISKECSISRSKTWDAIQLLLDKKLIIIDKVDTNKGKQSRYNIGQTLSTLYPQREQGVQNIITNTEHLVPTGGTSTPYLVPTGGTLPLDIPKKIMVKRKNKQKEKIDLPDWLPEEKWKEFLEFRKNRDKKQLSIHAQKIGISKLNELYVQGEDISKVIDQTIFCNYAGLFPVKKDFNAMKLNKIKELTPYQKSQENVKKVWDMLTADWRPTNEH